MHDVLIHSGSPARALALEAFWLALSMMVGLGFVKLGAPVFLTLLVFIGGILMAGFTALTDVLTVVRRWRSRSGTRVPRGAAWVR
jgi:hypothetical protein